MPYITANKSTPLKRRNEQLTDLPIDQYVMIAKGKKLAVNVFPMVGQTLKIVLAGNDQQYELATGETFFIYAPDWDAQQWLKKSPVSPPSVSIGKIPYFAQNDTSEDGFRLCNAHSNAMLCAYLLQDDYFSQARSKGDRYIEQPERLYIDRMRKFGDSTDHNVQTQTLETFGIKSYWSDRISPEDLHEILTQKFKLFGETIYGIPCVAGLAYKESGHIVLIKGFKGGAYVVNDPNGKRDGTKDYYYQKSTNVNKAGESDVLSKTFMDLKFWDLGRERGYGRIVTSVSGYPTGLK